MVEWFDPEMHLPPDGEECLIMPHASGGLVTTKAYGPIMWNEKFRAWVDIFATPEGGEMVPVADVGCWTLWEPIEPPDGLPTLRKESPSHD